MLFTNMPLLNQQMLIIPSKILQKGKDLYETLSLLCVFGVIRGPTVRVLSLAIIE